MDGEEARIWGRTWSQRILYSGIADQALEYGLADQAELQRISQGWETWAESEQPFFMFTQIAVLAVR